MAGAGGRPRVRLAPILFRLVVVAVGVTVAFWTTRRYRRYAIRGTSMEPALRQGDWVIVDMRAYRSRLPERGHIVVAADPRDPAHSIVKRVAGVDHHGAVDLRGDNAEESTDSRTFGPVLKALIRGRVYWRYWPPGSFGSVS